MVSVINVRMVGGAYKNGRRVPGWNELILDNGKTVYLSESYVGFDSVLEKARADGYDTTEITKRLDVWVKTGIMPPSEIRPVS